MPTDHDGLLARIDAAEAERDLWERRAKEAQRRYDRDRRSRYDATVTINERQEKVIRDDERFRIISALRHLESVPAYGAAANWLEWEYPKRRAAASGEEER